MWPDMIAILPLAATKLGQLDQIDYLPTMIAKLVNENSISGMHAFT